MAYKKNRSLDHPSKVGSRAHRLIKEVDKAVSGFIDLSLFRIICLVIQVSCGGSSKGGGGSINSLEIFSTLNGSRRNKIEKSLVKLQEE